MTRVTTATLGAGFVLVLGLTAFLLNDGGAPPATDLPRPLRPGPETPRGDRVVDESGRASTAIPPAAPARSPSDSPAVGDAIPASAPVAPTSDRPTIPMVVRVVDTDGRALRGVPVQLRCSIPPHHEQSFDFANLSYRVVGATTDRRGLARLAVPEAAKAEIARHGGKLSVASVTALERTIVKAWDPRTPIEIRTRPSGVVILLFRTPTGEAMPGELRVSLIAKGTPTAATRRRGGAAATVTGRWIAYGLRPGVRYRLSVSRHEVADAPDIIGVRPGETATHRVTIPLKQAFVKGRVLGPDGAPIEASLRIAVRSSFEEGPFVRIGRPVEIPAGAEGRFVVPVPTGGTNRTLRIHAFDRRRTVAAGTVPLKDMNEPVIHDLGDVRLRPAVRLAAGSVADDRGELLGERAPTELRYHGEHAAYGGALHGGWTKADADGHFEIWGEPTDRSFHVRAYAEQHAKADTGWLTRQAAQDVRLTLRRQMALAFRVVVPHGVFASDLTVSLDRYDGIVESDASVSPSGVMTFESVPVGRYRLVVRPTGGEETLAVVENVDPARGDDPRLDPIALSVSRCLWLRVIDPGGKPIANALVRLRPGAKSPARGTRARRSGAPRRIALGLGSRGGSQNRERRTDATGRVAFLSAHAPIPCVILADGYRSRAVDVDRDRTETLQRCYTVRVHFRFGAERSARISILPESGDIAAVPRKRVFVLKDDQTYVDFDAPAAGRYVVTAFRSHLRCEQRIEVREGLLRQTCWVHFPFLKSVIRSR